MGSQTVGHDWAAKHSMAERSGINVKIMATEVEGDGADLGAQAHLTLGPHGWYSPDSSAHGILQGRILEWVAISFSRGICSIQGSDLGLLHCGRSLPLQEDSLLTKPFIPKKVWARKPGAGPDTCQGKSRSDSASSDPEKANKDPNKTEPGGWMESHLYRGREEVHKMPRSEGFMSETWPDVTLFTQQAVRWGQEQTGQRSWDRPDKTQRTGHPFSCIQAAFRIFS